MKKLTTSFLAILFMANCTLLIAQSQNKIWSLPPNYYKFSAFPPVQSLPAPGGSTVGTTMTLPNYQPMQQAEYMHNAMQDASGNLLFFVVDGAIYDKDGYIIAQMNDGGISGNSYVDEVKGYTEILIIPVPSNCSQYYIVAANSAEASSHLVNSVYYSLLDLSVTSVETGRKGALLDPQNPTNQFIWSANNTVNLGNLAPDFTFLGESEPNTAMAVTELNNTTNERFLYINGDEALFKFTVTATGIVYSGYRYLLNNIYNPVPTIDERHLRAEMEIINTSTGYRLAMAYPNRPCVTCNPQLPNGVTVLVAELNTTGVIIGTSYQILETNNPSQQASVKGMEFSPNGNYVYITHDPNNVTTTNQTPFKIYDVVNQTFLSNTQIGNTQMLNDINNLDFYKSQIELSGENVAGGRMYLANSTNMATIDNVNNPIGGGLSWNNSAQNITYNLNNYNYPTTDFEKHIYILPDQIDGMDYRAYLVDPVIAGIECCIENSPYGVSVEDSTSKYEGTQTWADGSNNISGTNANLTSPIYVKDKMVIKSGANITINNMRFEFAPEAQLIIEDGARLTIDGTTLTADTRCDSTAMWHGVEVWGNGSNQPFTSGRFVAQNNSVIEHAMVATANFQHQQDANNKPIINTTVNGFNGGVIRAENTTFRNNYIDTRFESYSSNFNNDMSSFSECHFVTDAHLNNPTLNPYAHADLTQVRGLRFVGCVFEAINNALTDYPNIVDRGYGILAYEALFTVQEKCNSIVVYPNPCPNPTPSEFNNLFLGVSANGGSMPTQTAKITNSEFNNNYGGILYLNLVLSEVTNNKIVVGSNLVNNPAFGLYLGHSDQYKVENNNFSTTSGYFGCYINNSGPGANEIYNNTFENFVVATQAANTNGDGSAGNQYNQHGLVFRCNEYTNTSDFDILVSSGQIRSYQGECISNLSPANNQFSYTAQGDYWVNNAPATTFQSTYRYSPPNTYNLMPRNGFFNIITTAEQECYNLNSFDPNVSCPVRLKKTVAQLNQLIAGNKIVITNLYSQIDDNDTQGLLNLISTTSGGNLKNALMAASPYLSDEVLIAYILSNPSNGHLKQVLLANSPLSDKVMNVLAQQNLPKGIKKQIDNVQTGTSPMQELQGEISYYEAETDRYRNDILRFYLFDVENQDKGIKDVITYLETENCPKTNSKCLLTCAYLADARYNDAQAKVDTLSYDTANANFCKLYNSVIQYQQTVEKEYTLLTNTNLRTPVEQVSNETSQQLEVGKATAILNRINQINLQLPFEYVVPSGSSQRLANNEVNSSTEEQQTINVFPNPTKEQFTLTHNLNAANGIITLSIYDLMGRNLITETINNQKQVINTTTLKSGVYFYSIIQNNTTVKTDKLVIR